MIQSGGSRAFAYVTSEKVTLYRAIMHVFLRSKERFAFRLRPQEILNEVGSCVLEGIPDQTEIESALEQLCAWGNLEAQADTTDVNRVEDFYKQRQFFLITPQGEAAQQALEFFEAASEYKTELRTSALTDIQELLHELNDLSKVAELDSGKIHRKLLALRVRFGDLSSGAEQFMGNLQRKVDLQVGATGDSISDKRRLIDYLQRFIGELVIATDDIADSVRNLEMGGLEMLFQAAAQRGAGEAMEIDPEERERALDHLRSEWSHFRDWFISRPGCPSNAEILRGQTRASIPRLLNVITGIHDRLVTRIDRSGDLRVLARWFIEAESDTEAHKLWRSVFGLCSARHLTINDATLDEYEAQDLSPDASWLDAPPLKSSLRLRAYGTYSRSGVGLSRIIDRKAEKEKLASVMHEEALRLLRAQKLFVTLNRMRLSELAQLDADEFDVFLDLLGETASARVLSGETAEVLSSDGSLIMKLEPTGDGQTAAIHSAEGVFSGPDYWISVEPGSTCSGGL